MKILIIEDYKPSLEKLGAILAKQGHKVMSAETAKDGLDKYMNGSYDMVFIDWTLPDMDGSHLCMDIKDLNIIKQRDSYIIMTTGKAKKRDMVEALESGADDFMLKPFDECVVKSRIDIGKRFLDIRRSKTGTDIAEPIEILEKEHEVIHRITAIMEVVSNMLSEDIPIPKKLLDWCTSSAFIIDFRLHENKENYYIDIFIKRAKEEHGKTSKLFSRSSLTQIMKEHELIYKLIKNMQDDMAEYTVDRTDVQKRLKKHIDQYIQLIRMHAAREDDVFFPFSQRYFTDDDIKKLLADFKKIERVIGAEKIDARIKMLAKLEKALDIKG